MEKNISAALVLGLGKVGHLVARLLHETGLKGTGVTRPNMPGHRLPPAFRISRTGLPSMNHFAAMTASSPVCPVISTFPWYRLPPKTAYYFDLTVDVYTTPRFVIGLNDARFKVWSIHRCRSALLAHHQRI